jgi:hypothetical protein
MSHDGADFFAFVTGSGICLDLFFTVRKLFRPLINLSDWLVCY